MRHAIAILASALVVAGEPPALAQGDRVHLLSRFNAYDGMGLDDHDYKDVVGYRSSDGREVAVLGCFGGTSFIETTDPFNPVELAFIPRVANKRMAMGVWQTYVYVVTEGGGGLQIIDVSDLANIHLVTTWTGGFDLAHAISIDVTAGHAYVCGSDEGVQILDLADPTAPTIITNWTDEYVHEATVQDGVAHFAELEVGLYQMLDVSALPAITTIATVATPRAYTHSTVVDETGTLVCVTEEVVGGKVLFYDVSDPANITLRGDFLENGFGIFHKALLADGVAELAAYSEGYVAVDVRDPAHPIRLGSYDTRPGTSGGIFAATSISVQPSGVVYVCNIEDGLWVLCRETRIEHAPLPDTLDETGPYVVAAAITPSAAGGGFVSATLEFTTDDGATTTQIPMAPTAHPGEWSASIPGQPRGTTVQYWLRASDGLGTSNAPAVGDGRFVFGVGNRTSRYFEDFDGPTDDGWKHGKTAGSDDWQRGTPGRKHLDPYRTTSGSSCFGNDLGSPNWDGLYRNGASNWLESPAIDLSVAQRTRLRFSRWLRVDDSAMDVARVLVNGTEIWRNPTNGGTLPTLDPEWATMDFDISALADGVAATKVRFELQSDGSVQYGGWNVDDVEIYSVSSCRDPEDYGTGTAGSGGFVPVLTTVGDPILGNPAFEIDGSQLLSGASCYVAVGFARSNASFKGVTLLVDLTPPAFLVTAVASGPAGVAGVGSFQLFSEIDDDPSLDGVEVDLQILVIDPGGPKGLAASQGRALWLCR